MAVVLVVGAGDGYAVAIAARLASSVVALECDPTLAAQCTKTLNELGVVNAAVVVGDLKQGRADQGPFDVVLLGQLANLVKAFRIRRNDQIQFFIFSIGRPALK